MRGLVGGICFFAALFCIVGITTADVPNLVGNWTGPYSEYNAKNGFSEQEGGFFFLNITEQNNRIFAGYSRYTDHNGTDVIDDLAGVINSNGTEFSFVEKNNGYSSGKIISPDELEVTYLNDNDPISVAIDTFIRIS
ncbi:MAG: hypothetical protein LUQ50_04225 [Methanospirillum sp.]|uniref:hypothetical protein n=1 Tax=Methanospirillum sp. TaxID=45200 RepID=UPI0023705604|nr:hypothetical protein [Methanospirillum sp.]MDD1728263.1 hypothetical protein [Methanospirillum sp.]